jgi:hypothetical protein
MRSTARRSRRFLRVKGRPQFNPLITHFAEGADVAAHVIINEKAEMLAQAFWPGPLTMILQRTPSPQPSPKGRESISELATAGLDTIAVRVPNHPVSRKLIKSVRISAGGAECEFIGHGFADISSACCRESGRQGRYDFGGGRIELSDWNPPSCRFIGRTNRLFCDPAR